MITITSGSIAAAIAYLGYKRLPTRRNTILKNLSKPITPHNTIFTFDVHEVLCRPDYAKLIRYVITTPASWKLSIYFLYPPFLLDVWRIVRRHFTFEQSLVYMFNRYNNLKKYISYFRTLARMQKPCLKTIQLVKELHAAGYTLHILSNIGEPMLAVLKHDFPNLFEYFNATTTVSKQYNWQGKPYANLYLEYLNTHNPDNKQIFFIDDKKINIKTAQVFGMGGIRYQNAPQLKRTLQKLGVL